MFIFVVKCMFFLTCLYFQTTIKGMSLIVFSQRETQPALKPNISNVVSKKNSYSSTLTLKYKGKCYQTMETIPGQF